MHTLDTLSFFQRAQAAALATGLAPPLFQLLGLVSDFNPALPHATQGRASAFIRFRRFAISSFILAEYFYYLIFRHNQRRPKLKDFCFRTLLACSTRNRSELASPAQFAATPLRLA